jgi:hypothetical protein
MATRHEQLVADLERAKHWQQEASVFLGHARGLVDSSQRLMACARSLQQIREAAELAVRVVHLLEDASQLSSGAGGSVAGLEDRLSEITEV